MRKIPRTKIYLKLSTLLITLFKILLKKPKPDKKTKTWQEVFSRYFGKKHALALPRARLAFFYLLKNLNLPKESEIILTPLTIADMVNAIRWAKLRPVFCDLGNNTYNIDYQKLEQAITPKTKVILVTHLAGLATDMNKIQEIVKRNNLILIEDASQAFGGKFKNKYLSTFGLAGIFSLSFLKTCSTLFGGMLITDDSDLAEKIQEDIKTLPSPPKKILIKETNKNALLALATNRIIFSTFTYYGIKLFSKKVENFIKSNPRPSLSDKPSEKLLYSYSDIQAELGLKTIKDIKKSDDKRINNVKLLIENLGPEAKSRLPVMLENAKNTFWRLPMQVENPEDFQKYLFKHGVDSAQTNLVLCSQESAFKEYTNPTPEAQKAFRAVLIPIHSSFSKKDIAYLAKIVNSYFKTL